MLLTSTELAEFTAEIERANLLEIEKGDVETALSIYLMLWNKLPEPKHQQPEQTSNWIIGCIFNSYFDMGNYVEAKKWALEGLKNDTAQEGAYEYFQVGQVCYELKEFEEALNYFDIAYQRGKKRAFQEYDKKYWKFYSEHRKK